jgi:methanogenic corrinoid protein MtbC1
MGIEQNSQESLQCGWYSAEELPVPAAQTATGRRLAAQFARMVESEMVPRLLLVRHPPPVVGTLDAASPFRSEDVEELTRLLLAHDSAVASAYVEVLRQNGASTHQICLHLLAPAARRLGEMWDDDRCSFAEVTMGLCRLHQVLHLLTTTDMNPALEATAGKSNTTLLSCLPGEQHTFGVLVVSLFLRREGWDVWNEFPADNEELLQTVSRKPFKIIGLSVGRESRLRELTLLIKALRRASMNRSVAVMVGGPAVTLRPEIGGEIGADATMLDAPGAARWAKRYWDSVAVQS